MKPAPLRRRGGFAALALAVLVAHSWVAEWMAGTMAELASAYRKPARLEAVFVRDMALSPAPVSAPAAPPAPAIPPPARPTPPPDIAKAASAPDAAASKPLKAKPPTKKPPRDAPPSADADRGLALALSPAIDAVRQPPPTGSESPSEAPPVAVTEAASEPQPKPRDEPEPLPLPLPASAPASVPWPAERVLVPPTTAEPTLVASAGAASAPPFDWPVSTRVTYRLTGNVRGEVNGEAQVEWLRVDNRYQVHLDVTVGLSIAPLMTRRMSSDGEITPQGLSPRRYDQDTKVGFGARQRVAVLFEPGAIVLANGQRRERWPGMQDTASQFIQLTYLFSTQPELLRPGGALQVPLALPRNTSRWVYDVLGDETVFTPFGAVQAVHIRPRREVVKGGDLSAETWFAPQLRYLPVRIRIQQDTETFIDLVIARPPQLAGP